MPIGPGWAAICRCRRVRKGRRICETCVGVGGDGGRVVSCHGRAVNQGNDSLAPGKSPSKMVKGPLPVAGLRAHILSPASFAAHPDRPRSDRPIFAAGRERQSISCGTDVFSCGQIRSIRTWRYLSMASVPHGGETCSDSADSSLLVSLIIFN